MKRGILALLVIMLASAASRAQLLPVDRNWVEQTLHGMTLDEKIGQLFMPVHTTVEQTEGWVQHYHIGGIWFARTEARKIAEELNVLQTRSKYPLLVSVDFEKGAGTYVDGGTDLPINMALGATRDPRLVYEAAALTAVEARALGVHINFAPVMDVNNNPQNPVINTRSYGEDPKLVAALAAAAIQGYQDNGLLATGKHFPGHGNTGVDSHTMLGVVTADQKEFESTELFPYTKVFQTSRPAGIMSAHLWIRALDADTVPATLSSNAMTNLLRKRLSFDGIIFTDAMVMGGITTRYPFDVGTVKALQAGCDVILFPGDLEKGIQAVKHAVERGELSEKRIEESVRRILRAKTQVGLHKKREVDIMRIGERVGTEQNYRAAKAVAAQCLTLTKNEGSLVPVPSTKKVLVLTMSNKEGNSMVSRGLVSFPDEVRKLSPAAADFRLSDAMTTSEVDQALALAKNADLVVVAAYIKIVLNSGTVELSTAHTAFVNRLVEANPNIVLISFGNPYIGSSVPDVPAYICAYDNAKALQETAAEALFGKIPFHGRLPVTVTEKMRYGWGITTE
ncbi:MAG: glycoside hydrolase family 3 protein [Ignavibacteria bacterium]|nr:glycoside hydrolase family 3 protein [Ignavibacteria bacterium]